MKHGGEHLRPVTMDMPLYEFLCLDIVAVVAVILLSIFSLAMFIVFRVTRCCCNRLFTRKPKGVKSKRE